METNSVIVADLAVMSSSFSIRIRDISIHNFRIYDPMICDFQAAHHSTFHVG